MTIRLWLLLFSVTAPTLAVADDAQKLLTFTGQEQFDIFGQSIAGGEDLDGDGIADIVVGAILDDTGGFNSGSVFVYSGRDGSLLRVHSGEDDHEHMGAGVAFTGDVDGDGVAELLIGATGWGRSRGRVTLVSGRGGATIRHFEGEDEQDILGEGLACVGDVDGDGIDDFALGARQGNLGGERPGEAFVYSGGTGALIQRFGGETHGSHFGFALAGISDIDDDGVADLAIGAKNTVHGGNVYLYSIGDGSLIHKLWAEDFSDAFGHSLARVPDADGDGRDDLLVGAPWNSDNGHLSGKAYLYSPIRGFRLHTWSGSGFFGSSVAAGGDIDGDGIDDYLIGSSEDGPGKVFVYSGEDGSPFCEIVGTGNSSFGFDVAGASDINGDGFDDILASATFESVPGQDQVGAVHVYAGMCSNEAVATNYGDGFPGTHGIPGLNVSAPPALGTSFDLLVENSRGANTEALLLLGETRIERETPWGGRLLVAPDVVQAFPISPGENRFALSVPASEVYCGEVFYLQVLEHDPGALRGVSSTPGLQLTLGRE